MTPQSPPRQFKLYFFLEVMNPGDLKVYITHTHQCGTTVPLLRDNHSNLLFC